MSSKLKPQQRGSSFRVAIAHPLAQGRKISVTERTEEECITAAERLIRLREDVRAGRIGRADAARLIARQSTGVGIMVRDVWDAYIGTQRGTTLRTAASTWTNMLEETFGDLEAVDVNTTLLKTWAVRMERTYSPVTVHGAYSLLRTAFNLAAASPSAPTFLERVPWDARIKIGKSAKAQRREQLAAGTGREACRNWEEFEALLRAATEHDLALLKKGRWSDLAARVGIITLCGLRQSEAAALAWSDVEIDDGTPVCRVHRAVQKRWKIDHPNWIRPEDPPKDGPRHFRLSPGAIALLRAQRVALREHGIFEPEGPVFPNFVKRIPASDPLARWRSIPEVIEPAVLREVVRAAGLPNVERWVVHSLRHSFVTLEAAGAARVGANLQDVADRVGHSDLEMLAHYMSNTSRLPVAPSFTPAIGPGILRNPREVLVRPEVPPALAAGEPSPALPPADVDDAPTRELPDVTRAVLAVVADTSARELAAMAERRAVVEEKKRRRWRGKPGSHRKSPCEPIIRAWIDAGKPGEMPSQIRAMCKADYDRAYQATLRKLIAAGQPDAADKAKAAARTASKNRKINSFTRVLARIEGRPNRVNAIIDARATAKAGRELTAQEGPDGWGLADDPAPTDEGADHGG